MRTAKEVIDQAIGAFFSDSDDRVRSARETSDRKRDVPKAVKSPQQGEGQTSIGNDVYFRGEIVGGQAIFVDGEFEGTINLPGNDVTVGKYGMVHAEIKAGNIIVLGKIQGNVNATGRVELRAGSTLIGNIVAARIAVDDEALFKGDVEIRNSEASSEKDG